MLLLAVGLWLMGKGGVEFSRTDGEYTLWVIAPFFGLAIAPLGWTFLRDLVRVSQARRQPEIKPAPPAAVVITHWRDAEFLAMAHMQLIGYPDARETGPGSDGGIDVQATRGVAQVKMLARPVGRPAVQMLVGAAGQGRKRDLLFYSRQGYTKQAVHFADGEGVMLFQFNEACDVWAVNGAAHNALRAVG
ncbi:restriction endonuclease [[Kitasatospora] papulosa]|uniref:restriction endonuclease n=1 Tax=[Kitasatospora] papulosa TaxID=1464011 RepID=UPI0036C7F513